MINRKNHDKNTNFIMKKNRKLRGRVGLGIFYFLLNSPPLTGDVTCSRLYLDGKNMRRKYQMNNLH